MERGKPGDYQKSLEYFLEYEKRMQLNGDPNLNIMIMKLIRSCYFYIGDYPSALKYMEKSLKIDEDLLEGQTLESSQLCLSKIDQFVYHGANIGIL